MGGSSAAAEKAKKDLDPYFFRSLTDQYLKPRSTTSNISRINYKSSESMKENEGLDDEDDKGKHPYMEQSADVNERKLQLSQSRKHSASNSKLSRIEEKQLKLMEEMQKDMKKEREQQENPVEQCMIKKEIKDIIFKYQVSKFNRSGGQQTFAMSMGINPLNYSERTRDCFSPFLKQTGQSINAHYVPSQFNTSLLGSPEYLLREPTNVSIPTSQC